MISHEHSCASTFYMLVSYCPALFLLSHHKTKGLSFTSALSKHCLIFGIKQKLQQSSALVLYTNVHMYESCLPLDFPPHIVSITMCRILQLQSVLVSSKFTLGMSPSGPLCPASSVTGKWLSVINWPASPFSMIHLQNTYIHQNLDYQLVLWILQKFNIRRNFPEIW